MNITKFEQSGFIIENAKGFRLAIDIGNKTPLEKLDGVTCDAMFISHIHGDHFSLEQVKKLNPKKLYLNKECIEILGEEILPFEIITIKNGNTLTVDTFSIEVFNVDHGPNVSAPLLENFGFLINVDDQNIYFAGDMFYESEIDVSELEVDYLLLPVGTFYTFGPEEAFAFAQKFGKIEKIISMHYEKTPETYGQFLELAKGTFEVE